MITVFYEKDHCHISYNDRENDPLENYKAQLKNILWFFISAIDPGSTNVCYFRKKEEPYQESDPELIHNFIQYLNTIYFDLIEEVDYRNYHFERP